MRAKLAEARKALLAGAAVFGALAAAPAVAGVAPWVGIAAAVCAAVAAGIAVYMTPNESAA